jgi:hypothetical protein
MTIVKNPAILLPYPGGFAPQAADDPDFPS